MDRQCGSVCVDEWWNVTAELNMTAAVVGHAMQQFVWGYPYGSRIEPTPSTKKEILFGDIPKGPHIKVRSPNLPIRSPKRWDIPIVPDASPAPALLTSTPEWVSIDLVVDNNTINNSKQYNILRIEDIAIRSNIMF